MKTATLLHFLTQRTSEKYNLYFGQLHSHTSYSDGAGTAQQAYEHASGWKILISLHWQITRTRLTTQTVHLLQTVLWVRNGQKDMSLLKVYNWRFCRFVWIWDDMVKRSWTYEHFQYGRVPEQDTDRILNIQHSLAELLCSVKDSATVNFTIQSPGTTFGDFSDLLTTMKKLTSWSQQLKLEMEKEQSEVPDISHLTSTIREHLIKDGM